MKPDQFLTKARDPAAWHKKAVALRRSGDVVWKEFTQMFKDAIEHSKAVFEWKDFEETTDVLRNSQLLYSLAAECALKGVIIKLRPKEVVFETTVDATGELIDARITQIGKRNL